MSTVFVPVRHHSPACARLVRSLVRALRPSRVLIEGPSDFVRLDELLLPHQLPIAIYTFVRSAETRSGAYYPFCAYSPEWQAVRTAGELGIPFQFIDLPFASRALEPDGATGYADGALSRSRLVDALCAQLEVSSFDDVWDTLFEIPIEPDAEVLLERLRLFCGALREADESAGTVRASDLEREAFMRSHIAAALAQRAEGEGPVLVVTGGYHTAALAPRAEEPATAPLAPSLPEGADHGIALTPYSFARLDAHSGYASGMPSPGFYQALWDGMEPMPLAVAALRGRAQQVSTADLIAAEVMARGLATLRGHARVFRQDVLDGARAALVKDVMEADRHPALSVILEAFRGSARGTLAAGTQRPPLALEIEATLTHAGLWPEVQARTVRLALRRPEERAQSRWLHRAVALGLRGFVRAGGTDFHARADLNDVFESWELVWTPELEGDCIEASLYGATWLDAVLARFEERMRDALGADVAARLCVDAALAGLDALSTTLLARVGDALRADGDFARLAAALDHLLFLYRFDDTLGAGGAPAYLALLVEAYERGVWLLTTLTAGDPPILSGVSGLLAARRRCSDQLALGPLVDVLTQLAHDGARAPALRGAAAGGLFTLADANVEDVVRLVSAFARPEQLGDFLTGLFTVARDAVRHDPSLMLRLDELLLAYSDDDFLLALPALRLAFSFFPPREKHHLIQKLLEARGDAGKPLAALAVDPLVAAGAAALERSTLTLLNALGVRALPQRKEAP